MLACLPGWCCMWLHNNNVYCCLIPQHTSKHVHIAALAAALRATTTATIVYYFVVRCQCTRPTCGSLHFYYDYGFKMNIIGHIETLIHDFVYLYVS